MQIWGKCDQQPRSASYSNTCPTIILKHSHETRRARVTPSRWKYSYSWTVSVSRSNCRAYQRLSVAVTFCHVLHLSYTILHPTGPLMVIFEIGLQFTCAHVHEKAARQRQVDFKLVLNCGVRLIWMYSCHSPKRTVHTMNELLSWTCFESPVLVCRHKHYIVGFVLLTCRLKINMCAPKKDIEAKVFVPLLVRPPSNHHRQSHPLVPTLSWLKHHDTINYKRA